MMAESIKMTIFGESINHNQDYGLPSRFREPIDEIHRNICPNTCRDGKYLQGESSNIPMEISPRLNHQISLWKYLHLSSHQGT